MVLLKIHTYRFYLLQFNFGAAEHARLHAGFLWLRRAGLLSRSSGAQYLWCMSSPALQHVGSSGARNRTCVPCLGRRILNHWTTREAPPMVLLLAKLIINLWPTHWLFLWEFFLNMCESEMNLVLNVLLHSANTNKIKVMKTKLSPASLQETIKETRPDRFPSTHSLCSPLAFLHICDVEDVQ